MYYGIFSPSIASFIEKDAYQGLECLVHVVLISVFITWLPNMATSKTVTLMKNKIWYVYTYMDIFVDCHCGAKKVCGQARRLWQFKRPAFIYLKSILRSWFGECRILPDATYVYTYLTNDLKRGIRFVNIFENQFKISTSKSL